jgi:hypothetical protein
LTELEKYSALGVREDADGFGLVGMPIFLGRIGVEFMPVRVRRCKETIVKVWTLRESETSPRLVREPTEVPNNFFQLGIVAEHLCHGNQIPGTESVGSYSRRTTIG